MPSQPSSNILVIESDPEEADRSCAHTVGQRISLAETITATAALEADRSSCPDALLLDPELPDMDGLDVIRQIRPAKLPVSDYRSVRQGEGTRQRLRPWMQERMISSEKAFSVSE
jgi:CheY-like chemotaxis protein